MRRMVSCGLVDHDVMRIEASDGTVWFHSVDRDEHGRLLMAQVDKWLALVAGANVGPHSQPPLTQ
jgi:hypothetical protein